MRSPLASLSLVLVLAACGAEEPASDDPATSAGGEAILSRPSEEQLYEVDATVVDGADGPMICLGPVRMILSPTPQCGTVPISNWDWDAVEGEESVEGTTWGSYHLVGAYYGGVFRVTGAGRFENRAELAPFVHEDTCPEPAGGWFLPDPERMTQEEARPAHAYARSQPDYVTSWNDHLDEEREEFSPVVVVVGVFTREADRYEAEIREVWDGPLCVVERDVPTARQLAEIRRTVEAQLPELGLELLGSATGGLPPTIAIDVVADPGGAGQAALDERYGSGVVRLVPVLREVAG